MNISRLSLVLAMSILILAGATAVRAAAPEASQVGMVSPLPVPTGTVPITTTLTPTLPYKLHPVAVVLSNSLGISYTEVISLHESGVGFGVIARAYLTARFSGGQLTPDQALAAFQSGEGWGQIMKEYGVHPGGKGLGSLMGARPQARQRAEEVRRNRGTRGPGGRGNR